MFESTRITKIYFTCLPVSELLPDLPESVHHPLPYVGEEPGGVLPPEDLGPDLGEHVDTGLQHPLVSSGIRASLTVPLACVEHGEPGTGAHRVHVVQALEIEGFELGLMIQV